MFVDYPVYDARIRELQSLYERQIDIKIGMEFGIQTHTFPNMNTCFKNILLISLYCPYIR